MRHSVVYAVVAVVLLTVCASLAAAYVWSPHEKIRITVGPVGGEAEQFVAAMTAVAKQQHPLVSFVPVAAANPEESSALLDKHAVDLAIVRSDASPPVDGQTIVILRRDVAAFLVPPKSKVDSLPGLSGKTVVLLGGRIQQTDQALLDAMLSYYNVPLQSVHRLIVPEAELGKVLREKPVGAVFVVGPVGRGRLSDAVATITRSVGTPTLLTFDDADGIATGVPGTESLDLPKGALRGRPEIPDDSATVVAVTYRLAAPFRMLNVQAGAIARAILTAKSSLVAAFPQAAQIEAPDPDKNTSVLPVHPGVAQYLSSGEQSFLDEIQGYLYAATMLFSVLGSIWAMAASRLRGRRDEGERKQIGLLINIADEARTAPVQDLARLEGELHQTLATIVQTGASDATTTLAASHAQAVLAGRRQTAHGPQTAATQ